MDAPAEQLREAIAQHRAGDYFAAEAGYAQYLKQVPNDPSGMHFLGLLRTHQGREQEGIDLISAALRLDPEYVDAWSNLAIALFHKRDLERAEQCCRKAIELAPDFANAWGNLGMILRARDAYEEALTAWRRALELRPNMPNVAIPYGHLLYRLDRIPEGLEFYRRWSQAVPDDPIAAHMLAALGGAERPARASDGYIRATFDDFADSFDRSLDGLKYQAPQLLHEAIASLRGEQMGALNILDVGCGTGLCGPLLRPLARRLIGVDLSPKMLSKAAARGVYDQLNCAELTDYLGTCGTHFDVVIAADVLCYFGDLSVVFARIRDALAAGGHFACSLEAADDAGQTDPFVLRPHGRYQHARAYVEQALQAAGLRLVALSERILRYERNNPVGGLVVLATPAH
jgi:predicted TPR repeat methyltransferase